MNTTVIILTIVLTVFGCGVVGALDRIARALQEIVEREDLKHFRSLLAGPELSLFPAPAAPPGSGGHVRLVGEDDDGPHT
jgi:hypothetical protein